MSSAPSISIVTPSYNQGQFLRTAIDSVLRQEYSNLEYVVMDGGSTDGSARMIKEYEPRLAHWSSEPDGGMYFALDRGFRRTTGEIMAWINSDDSYLPWTFSVVAEVFRTFPRVEWLTTLYPLGMDERGVTTVSRFGGGFSRRSFHQGANLPNGSRYFRGWIMQEGTFWRRSLWDKAGAIMDTSLKLAADFELWSRFYSHAELYGLAVPLAMFRFHPQQKTATQLPEYLKEAESVLQRDGHRKPARVTSATRRVFNRAIGGRPLWKLPPLAAGPLCATGLLNRTSSIVWESGRWKVLQDYVV